ncbi:MAG: prepilin-type N-terminal cleavage/methylation domain-containing protein, partial [Planctomycetes bacterium]|nr:prepilin-type N-terminal cleavage/methylation domain-containing protein [Planctomycetota bacterium]
MQRNGFTLVELLIVMMVLGVLAGIGIGFLQRRGNDVDIALAMIRDQVRAAALTARSKQVPATVTFDPGEVGGSASVEARVLVPVAHWALEDGRSGDSRLTPDTLTGRSVPGRFGLGRRPDPDATLLTFSTEEVRHTLFDLRDGFVVGLDVKLDDRAEMALISLDRNLVLELDEDLFVRAKIAVAGKEQVEGSVELESDVPLRLHRWASVRVVHDGDEASLWIDDRACDRKSFHGSIWQGDNDTLRVSEEHAPILGIVDEVRVMAYERTDRQYFPVGVELVTDARNIRFDREGRLGAPVSFELVYGEERLA